MNKIFVQGMSLREHIGETKMNLKKIDDLTMEDIASICDHTFLKRSEGYKKTAQPGESPVELREKEFKEFIEKMFAGTLRPYSLCVRPEDVALAVKMLKESNEHIKVISVVGFPDGSLYDTKYKLAETKLAIEYGAKEIDMVLDYEKFESGTKENLDYVTEDMQTIVDYAHQHNIPVKLILETSELNSKQIRDACILAEGTGVDFVKTSTGFGAHGAKAEDLHIMRANFTRGIKMSGGVGKDNVKELLKAASGRNDGLIDLNPMKIRIGSSSIIGEGKY